MSIPELLNYEVFAGITAAHIIGAVILIFVANFVWSKLKKKERPDVYDKVRCYDCGWVGDVSRYHKVCRKCAGNSLEKLPNVKK